MHDVRTGDCRIVLADASWDVMITDPPYSSHVHESATSCGTPGSRRAKGMRGAAHRDLGFDCLTEDTLTWVCEAVAKKTRKWAAIFSDTESVGVWQARLKSAGARYIRSIPWCRWSMPSLCGWPAQGCEMIVVAYGYGSGRKHWNGPGNLTHFTQTCMRGKNKHKAQKPLDLILDLVEFFSDEGEVVCDPFSASGTTALASGLLVRGFVGSELDPDWAEKARNRLDLSGYDDQERWTRYRTASEIRVVDMNRMKTNTERIRLNRLFQSSGLPPDGDSVL
jgi:hypothetical protein